MEKAEKLDMYDKRIYHPYQDFEDDKMYKCFEYSRVSGAGIEYNTIQYNCNNELLKFDKL